MMYDSPQKRYEDLLEKHSDKISNLPQHLLANYLGVTKETLSRIRSRIVKKQTNQLICNSISNSICIKK